MFMPSQDVVAELDAAIRVWHPDSDSFSFVIGEHKLTATEDAVKDAAAKVATVM